MALNEPPAPELVVATTMPLMPFEPNGPIVTTKFWFAGKLAVWIVTVVSVTTLVMLKVGIVLERTWLTPAKAATAASSTTRTRTLGRINDPSRPFAFSLTSDEFALILGLLTIHLLFGG